MNYKLLETAQLYDFRHFLNRKGRKDLRKVHKENKLSIVRNGSTLWPWTFDFRHFFSLLSLRLLSFVLNENLQTQQNTHRISAKTNSIY